MQTTTQVYQRDRRADYTPLLFKTHVDAYDEFEYSDEVDPTTYRVVLNIFNKLLHESMIYEGTIYKFPYSLGILGIRKKKSKRFNMNFQHFKETGEVIQHRNWHSQDWIAKIFYDNRYRYCQFPIKYKNIFDFHAVRVFKRNLSKAIKESNTINKYY